MTETKDIVERLRLLMRPDWHGVDLDRARMAREAADEIESLRAEVGEYLSEVLIMRAEIERLHQAADALPYASAIRARGGK